MSKAVLVIEMPSDCYKCQLADVFGTCCVVRGKSKSVEENKPDWCPLVPVPERKEVIHTARTMMDFERKGFQKGWNACIDALGGK